MENILDKEEIPKAYLEYFRERQKNKVYQEVLKLFLDKAEQGLSKKDLALRIGKEPAQLTRWFSGPGNWTLDTVSDLLIGMGSELDFKVSNLKEKPTPNYQHPMVVYKSMNEDYSPRETHSSYGNG